MELHACTRCCLHAARVRPVVNPALFTLTRLAAAERVEAEGDVATAFTLARIISNIPLARGGPGARQRLPLPRGGAQLRRPARMPRRKQC